MVRIIRCRMVGFVTVVFMIALPAFAQVQTGEIEGVVKDESGGVLPGVTVEVESPALIEGRRVVTTEASGVYRFLRLPVGTYMMKFTLAGFLTVERTGIVINAGFTATINTDMKVGNVTETITVTGESPIVDVRGSTTRTVLTSAIIEAIPSARNIFDMSKFVIGASTGTPDVGGSTQHLYTSVQIHGSRSGDIGYYRDGVRVAAYFGTGDAPRMYATTGAQQEVNYETAALPASVAHGGVAINMVSKDGGNRLSGSVFFSGANKKMQSSNLDDNLRKRGVFLTSGMDSIWDFDVSTGLPIKKNRVWFFGEVRRNGVVTLLANQRGLDGKQAINSNTNFDWFLKTTMQLNDHNKLAVSFAYDGHSWPYRREEATFVSDEAAGYNTSGRHPFDRIIVGNWTFTRGNNWILEVGFGYMRVGATTVARPEVKPDAVAHLDLGTSTLTGVATRIRGDKTFRQDYNVSATHVFDAGGTHELRFGSQGDWGHFPDFRENPGDIIQRYRYGVPESVQLINTPVYSNAAIREFGFYVQDAWRIAKRLTINAGARYDYFRVFIPEQYAPAGTYVGERQFPKIPVVTWQNVVPRIGVAYDLLGTGRTVIKGSFSKYMAVEAVGVAQDINPMLRSTNTCTWADQNGDDRAQLDELSKCQGWSGGVSTTLDPALRRAFNREYNLGVQHELARDLALSVMFFRRENRDARTTMNLAVPYDSYLPIQITNPLNNEPLTIYNQNPATAGKQQNVLTNSERLRNNYNGIEVAVLRRFSPGAYLQVGYHYGRAMGWRASGNDPNGDIFGYGAIGNDEPHQLKVSGSYVLPWDIAASGFISLASGHARATSYAVTRSMVPSLTRASLSVPLEPNYVNRYDARKLVDLRFGRIFRMGGGRQIEPFLDIYNLFNVNTVLSQTNTYGPSFGTVSGTINPRIARGGVKVTF